MVFAVRTLTMPTLPYSSHIIRSRESHVTSSKADPAACVCVYGSSSKRWEVDSGRRRKQIVESWPCELFSWLWSLAFGTLEKTERCFKLDLLSWIWCDSSNIATHKDESVWHVLWWMWWFKCWLTFLIIFECCLFMSSSDPKHRRPAGTTFSKGTNTICVVFSQSITWHVSVQKLLICRLKFRLIEI